MGQHREYSPDEIEFRVKQMEKIRKETKKKYQKKQYFNEFLEKERMKGMMILETAMVTGTKTNSDDFLLVRALGEWAMSQIEFHLENTWTENNSLALLWSMQRQTNPQGLALRSAYHEIAEACLGKEEVVKRLKEVLK